jgi:hypothetical protein
MIVESKRQLNEKEFTSWEDLPAGWDIKIDA